MGETADYQKIPSPLNADTVGNKSYAEISLEIDTEIGVHAGASDPHTPYLLAAGTRALSDDWDIGAGRMIQTEKIQARSNLGLSLLSEGALGIFIKDGGNTGVFNKNPGNRLSINVPNNPDALADMMIGTSATTMKGLVIQGKPFQTANLQDWQTHEGVKQALVRPDGSMYFNGPATDTVFNGDSFNGAYSIAGGLGYWAIRTGAAYEFNIDIYNGGASLAAITILQNANIGIRKVPSYPLDIDGDINIDSGHVFRVNATQVVGARVIDDRIDDVIEAAFTALYPVASGILDALRDAVIAHGLVAAT